MKKLIVIIICLLTSGMGSAQGLEGIIVEKYYITDEQDTLYQGSASVPINTVTYRIYVDMKPGYLLQSVYGAPGHEMKLSTSTFFFNHPLHGHYISNLIMDRILGITTVMLDSWISMGAASQQRFGILKEDDDTLETVVNGFEPPILQSKNPEAGLPLKERDGLIRSVKPPRVTQLGLDSLLDNLARTNSPGNGYVFSTFNGAWACVGGASGPIPDTNRVLIGQFTTNGDFYFEFNVQIGSAEHGVEQYVSRNPAGSEILNNDLIISFPYASPDDKK